MKYHQFLDFIFYLCSFFLRKAYLNSSSRRRETSFGKTGSRLYFPLEMELSDLLFLLLLLGKTCRGLFESTSLSVILEWLFGTWVLVSFKRAVKLSTSFSNIIRFLLHSFSSWLRLNEISLTFSESVFTYLSSLLLISFMHISIFLFISALSLSYNSWSINSSKFY